MVSVTFVCKDPDMTVEGMENWVEAVLDNTGIKPFCDRVLINNKEVWKLGDKTLKDCLRDKN